MRSELLFIPYLFVLLWDGLYFSKESFWNKLGDKPNWGNNEALFIVLFVVYTFLFSIAIYVSYTENKKKYYILVYYIFILLILAIPYVMSQQDPNNEETFIFSAILLPLTIISLTLVKNNTIRDRINIAVILALIIYLFIWFEYMKDK